MLKTLAAVLIFTLISVSGLAGQERGFGAGVILGEPTGLSGKIWLGNTNAVDFGVAWAFGSGGNFHLHSTYLFQSVFFACG